MTSFELENELKSSLEYCPGLVNGPFYSVSQKQLGEIYFAKGQYLDSIYHFSEAHAVVFRQVGVLEIARSNNSESSQNDPLSFHSSYSKEGVEGMLNRLKEMPAEWTILQLTRGCKGCKQFEVRKAQKSPVLNDLYLTRFPCGSGLDKYVPVIVKLSWPSEAPDLIQSFLEMKEKLGQKRGTAAQIRKIRQTVSQDLEKHCREIGPMFFKEWTCLLLGKLYNKALENEIREIIDDRLDESMSDFQKVTDRQKYLCYLLAEGSCNLENSDLEVALYYIFEGNESIAVRLLEALIRIKETYGSKLHLAKRHPVLLILDDHLDAISWECLPVLKRHPVSRVYSLHVAHALYSAHKDYIRDGVREIDEDDICYYIVNPDGNLPSLEEKIPKFLKKRFPSSEGIIGKTPSEEEIIKALTEYNSYVYCGHGSGSQYIASERIQRLKVKPLQLLYGCSSVALQDIGGLTEMHGDVMEYALARSGCTLGMLWPVTCNDTDKITMVLANMFLPGTPIDINTFEPIEENGVKKERELLRAMREVRECVDLFSNGAALVARGIPIKLVTNIGKNSI